jgi:hypothetical protein
MDIHATRSQLRDLAFTSNGLITVAVTLITVTTLTYLVTTIQGAFAARNKSRKSSPPTLPYAIPLLGHLPEFLKDTRKFLDRAT